MTSAPPRGGVAVSVVLPCAGAGHHLADQLRALASQDASFGWEVVLADNGCTAECLAVWESERPALPLARRVDATMVRGPAHARNDGALVAMGPLVLFCDDDDEVDVGWVRAMAAGLRDADLVGGRLRTERLNPPELRRGRAALQEEGLPNVHGHLPYAMSCSMGVRRELFLRLGGFDTSLYPGEDVDLSWRVQEAGGTVAFVPDAVTDYRHRARAADRVRQQAAYGRTAGLLRRKHRAAVPPLRARDELVLALRIVWGSRHLIGSTERRTTWLATVRYWGAERRVLVGLGGRGHVADLRS